VTKISLALAAFALLALSGVCGAQQPPGGITPEMIASALPEEGAPKAEPGPYQVTAEPATGTPSLKTFRPASLDRFPKRDTMPVVVWGNGGCAIENSRYAGFLTTIASHGFLVITTAGVQQEGTPRRQATADDLKAAIDWAERENARAGSPLNGKIETKRVAVMGQSCGGFLSITLGADPRVGTIGVFNSGVQAASAGAPPSTFPTTDALKKLHGPVLLINGHERDFMMARWDGCSSVSNGSKPRSSSQSVRRSSPFSSSCQCGIGCAPRFPGFRSKRRIRRTRAPKRSICSRDPQGRQPRICRSPAICKAASQSQGTPAARSPRVPRPKVWATPLRSFGGTAHARWVHIHLRASR
jgi:dienelactone hydrolase